MMATKALHRATKTTRRDLDATDRKLLADLRKMRRTVAAAEQAQTTDAPAVIAELRARGVDPEMIAEAFGVVKSRIYQVPPANAR